MCVVLVGGNKAEEETSEANRQRRARQRRQQQLARQSSSSSAQALTRSHLRRLLADARLEGRKVALLRGQDALQLVNEARGQLVFCVGLALRRGVREGDERGW